MYHPPNIALRSSSPFAPRCVPANHTESHSIHNEYRIRSLPSSPWRFPSSPASCPWPSQMGSVWTTECAYTPLSRYKIGVQRGKCWFSTAISCSAGSSGEIKSMECRTFYRTFASFVVWTHRMRPVVSLFYLLRLQSELCRMFVSRAVAAEVLMEAETNRMGYAALKTLDCEGGLRFSLAYVLFFSFSLK